MPSSNMGWQEEYLSYNNVRFGPVTCRLEFGKSLTESKGLIDVTLRLLSSKDKYPIFGLFDLRGGGLDVTFGEDYFGMGLTTGFPF